MCPLAIIAECPDGSIPTDSVDPATGCPIQTCPDTDTPAPAPVGRVGHICPLVVIKYCWDGSEPVNSTNPTTGCLQQKCPTPPSTD